MVKIPKFAPVRLPAHRRLQTLAVLLWVCLLPLCMALFGALLLRPTFWPFCLAYMLYIYYDTAPEHGGRRVEWVRNMRFWKWFADYFPVKLVASTPLDPSRNYVFVYSPHGIISIGAFCSFGTNAADIHSIFPGLNVRLLTLASNFRLPLYRELLLSLNICSVSRRSCERILRQGPGHSLMIVVGGAAESLNAYPFTYDLTLKRRLGFVKVALRAGADLVPVLGFGENDIFDQVENRTPDSKLRGFQRTFQSMFGFTTPMFHGRGIFNYDYGVMPYRRPITVVTGTPVRIESAVENPSDELVKEYHQKYMDALMQLWDAHKDVYAANRERELRIVE